VLADDVAGVADHDSRVPDRVPVRRVAFEDGADDDGAPVAREALQHPRRRPVLGRLGKLAPALLARAKRKRHRPGVV
jgi:hypothetical protein